MLNHYSYSVTTFNFINAKAIMLKESLFKNEIIRMAWRSQKFSFQKTVEKPLTHMKLIQKC